VWWPRFTERECWLPWNERVERCRVGFGRQWHDIPCYDTSVPIRLNWIELNRIELNWLCRCLCAFVQHWVAQNFNGLANEWILVAVHPSPKQHNATHVSRSDSIIWLRNKQTNEPTNEPLQRTNKRTTATKTPKLGGQNSSLQCSARIMRKMDRWYPRCDKFSDSVQTNKLTDRQIKKQWERERPMHRWTEWRFCAFVTCLFPVGRKWRTNHGIPVLYLVLSAALRYDSIP